ncbi:MAG: GNAT family N-acetyltransferase [Rhodobacteraceae bacterium]|nr:GNAT family N-acetyltransferase [Paracoccaceae bacterium]
MEPERASSLAVEVSVCRDIRAIPSEEWDACACPEETAQGRPVDPFTTHRFLRALEASDSVSAETGWIAFHLVARQQGSVIAVMPVYAKMHSQGEYVFDHAWANAFEQAGGRYYPKLQSAVPFTPVTGRRVLARPGFEEMAFPAMLEALKELTSSNSLSSAHITFCTAAEAQTGKALGMLVRHGIQFHWENRRYRSFEEFLGALTSRKRKNIRRERRLASQCGGDVELLAGDQIKDRHWDVFWEFYQDTGARKWGMPYLTREFFTEMHRTMRNDILLVMCRIGDEHVAGALHFIGRDALYGRYWGCSRFNDCLHFELCYYRAIDYAIEKGMSRVEAGAQGPHKLARGYMATPTFSLHWMEHEGFRLAMARYLEQETRQVELELSAAELAGPFRKDTA